jgi:hypothetical protein
VKGELGRANVLLLYSGKPSEDGGVKQDTTALEWYSSTTVPGYGIEYPVI